MVSEGIVGVKSINIFIWLMQYEYHPMLRTIAAYVLKRLMEEDVFPVITSAYRKEDTGVHKYFRALDFRSHGIAQEVIDEICNEVNSIWEYDPKRPSMVCLMYHDVGRGPHFHLQVHPNTKEL